MKCATKIIIDTHSIMVQLIVNVVPLLLYCTSVGQPGEPASNVFMVA